MNIRWTPGLAVLTLAACGGIGSGVSQLQADPLYKAAEAVRAAPDCAVASGLGRSLPVPAHGGGYAVLLYPVLISPSKSDALTPQYRADFAVDGPNAAARCVKIASGAALSLGPAVPPGVSNRDYYAAEASLFAVLPKLCERYRRGSPTALDREEASAFFDAFQRIAEPGLAPYYYRLNPEFWEWLRAAGGRSLAKPATP
ncbi:MAG: hypothetical protein HKL90_15880 [Elusimicrobia bacterium]|nr:hypothetical protein [Elusimicrobiota bacterium]